MLAVKQMVCIELANKVSRTFINTFSEYIKKRMLDPNLSYFITNFPVTVFFFQRKNIITVLHVERILYMIYHALQRFHYFRFKTF